MRPGQFPQSRLTFAMGERDDVAPSPTPARGGGRGDRLFHLSSGALTGKLGQLGAKGTQLPVVWG